MVKKHEIVAVTWFDTASSGGWKSIEEAKKWGEEKAVVISYGKVLTQNKHSLVLTSMEGKEDETYNQVTKIPIGCVLKVKRLK